MEIERVIQRVLELRRARLDDMGVTVVQQSRPIEVNVAVSDEEVGLALTQMLDGALYVMTARKERCLTVWAREANRGAVVEIEYRGGSCEEAQSRLNLSQAQKQDALRDLARCRELLERRGARLFVSSSEQGNIRFVMELPPGG